MAGASSGTAAVGAAVSYNLIGNTITSYIENSTVDSTGSSLTVSADSAPFVVSIAVGGAGAATFSFGGSVSINSIANDVDSHISDGSNVSTKGNASVLANESATMLTAAGGVAASTGAQSGAVGAAIAYNFVGGGFNPSDPDQTNPSPTTSDGITAYIDDSTVNVGGTLTVAAGFGPPSSLPGSSSLDIAVATIPLPETISDQVTSVTAAGAGAGTFALGGAINLNFIDNTIDAHISGGSQVTAGSVALGALDSSTIQSLSGQVTVATSINSGAVGAAVVVNQIDNTIQSYIAGSTVTATAGDVTDEAQSNHNIDTGCSPRAAAALARPRWPARPPST